MSLLLENAIAEAWMTLRVLSVSLLYVYDNIVVFCSLPYIRHRFNTFFRFLVFYIKKNGANKQGVLLAIFLYFYLETEHLFFFSQSAAPKLFLE